MEFFDKRQKELERAMFWLNAANEAAKIVDSLNRVNPNIHTFWTHTELSKKGDKYIEILTYCLMRYKHAIMRAE